MGGVCNHIKVFGPTFFHTTRKISTECQHDHVSESITVAASIKTSYCAHAYYVPVLMTALGFFFSSSWLTNVDGMKDLWFSSCSSAAINTDMNEKIYGALVQFGCYQHRYEWKGLWCSSTVWVLSTQT